MRAMRTPRLIAAASWRVKQEWRGACPVTRLENLWICCCVSPLRPPPPPPGKGIALPSGTRQSILNMDPAFGLGP